MATSCELLTARTADGEAGARQVRVIEARCGPSILPFILETGGRPTKEAREWVQGIVRATVQDGSPAVLGSRLWAHLSCTLQRYIAMQLRRAEGHL